MLHHQGELMVATNLFAVYGKPATMSRITLAFMQDTGWYDVDMDAAGYLNWGAGAGCDFVEKTCADWIAQNPSQQFFCTREQYADTVNTMCTFDGLARARCEDAQFADGCGMKVCVCVCVCVVAVGLLRAGSHCLVGFPASWVPTRTHTHSGTGSPLT